MRGRDAIAVALRHPDGQIVYATERLDAGFHGTRWSKWPLIRGLVVLYETLVVGTRWLVRSANVQASDGGRRARQGLDRADARAHAASPGSGSSSCCRCSSRRSRHPGRTTALRPVARRGPDPGRDLPRLPAASSRRSPDIRPRVPVPRRRAHDDPRPRGRRSARPSDAVRKYPTAHQRCGTEFLVVVILLSIIAFSLVGRQAPLVMIASRILLIPVIAAVGYEILRFGARASEEPDREGRCSTRASWSR